MIAIKKPIASEPPMQDHPSEKKPEATEKPANWYFTFGFGHPNHNKYYVIFGTYDSARQEMFETFGPKWAFQYSEDDWMMANGQTQAEYYSLTEL